MEVNLNPHEISLVHSTPQVCDIDYSITITESTNRTHPDEFVLDLSALQYDTEGLFDSKSNVPVPYNLSIFDDTTLAKGFKRRIENEDDLENNFDETSSGYESESEQDEDVIDGVLARKQKKTRRYNKYKDEQNNTKKVGEKRKHIDEESVYQKKKRLKTYSVRETKPQSSLSSNTSFSTSDTSSFISNLSSSSSDLSSSSSDTSSSTSESSSSTSDSSSSSSDSSSCSSSCADSCTSSDSSSSDIDCQEKEMPYKYLNYNDKVRRCPRSCVCKSGLSLPPAPIFRTSRTVLPLYKKLLQRRLLSISNTFYETCCSRECYRDWARKRVSLARIVRDYAETDLRVDYFSWGKWKQEPEVKESGSSDEDWFW